MKKVNVYPRMNQGEYPNLPKGKIVGYFVDEGKVDGKRKRTTHKTKEDAEKYAYTLDVQREAKQYQLIAEFGELITKSVSFD